MRLASLLGYDYFVSYSHKQRPSAASLVQALQAKGFRLFIDQQNVRKSDYWPMVVERAIRRSQAGIFIVTRESKKSSEVQAELRHLFSCGCDVYAIVIGGTELPEWLAAKDIIRITDESDASWNEAASAIALKVPRWWQLSLWAVAALLAASCAIPVGGAVLSRNRLAETHDAVRQLQERIQIYDHQVSSIIPEIAFTGEFKYVDPATGRHIATDQWENGALLYRWFYEGEKVVAQDAFPHNAPNSVAEKRREYIGPDRKILLIDYFTSTGALRLKCVPQDGDPTRCIPLRDKMHSPLPPPSVLFYR